jgi:hypothetical protein
MVNRQDGEAAGEPARPPRSTAGERTSRSGDLVFPGGRRFAFTILDDTDDSRVDNAKPIYDLLAELGLRTTKTVWPVGCPEGSREFFAGATMADPEYRSWCLTLPGRGFELTWHCATMESSLRHRTEEGLEAFRATFGDYPRIHANHAQNRENIYWGHRRYRTAWRWVAALALHRGTAFEGEVEGSPYFWGDLCRRHMRFTRNFAFAEVNTLRADPEMPYRLDSTPMVHYWFSATDVPDVRAFNRLLTPASLDRLAAEGGACLVATHLGKGFVQNGRVDPGAEATLRHLARLPGWFVPVSELLEYLLQSGRGRRRGWWSLARLEGRHLVDRFLARRWQ